MNTQKRLLVISAAIFFSCTAQPSRAELVISFSNDDGATFSDQYEMLNGETLEIAIYARELSPDTVLSTSGLAAFGLDLDMTPVSAGEITNVTTNPPFELQNHNVVSASGFEWEYGAASNQGIFGTSIRLGSFQFRPTAVGQTEFVVQDRLMGSGVGNASWLTTTSAILDEQIFGPEASGSFGFTITTSAVPEPSASFLLLSLFGCLFVRRRRR